MAESFLCWQVYDIEVMLFQKFNNVNYIVFTATYTVMNQDTYSHTECSG